VTDVEFLQWALPRVGLRWAGFRKVRRQVLRRVRRRLEALGLTDLDSYRKFLEAHPAEWESFAALTPVTISRFYRDRAVFDALERVVLPALGSPVRAWSAGCASGEEAYTLALLGVDDVLATDIDPTMLRRAEAAVYEPSSLRELPAALRERGFDQYALRGEFKQRVRIRRHDVRDPAPGEFDLILCRNAAFTYFDTEGQAMVLGHLTGALRPGGALVVGLHEKLPLEPWPGARAVYAPRQRGAARTASVASS
jgi:chemotaxis protein methyltransferase CheR